ncbi:MAG TPA: sialidase family protein [Streptosporangiaceae bacterium]|nr:sialidase family protein [Streptosporangiaceae bacterium]
MTDPRDRLENWLTEPVRPMLPRPGTFEQVSQDARRRRTRRAVLSAAGAAAVVVVAAVVIPQVAIPALEGGQNPPVNAAHGTSAPVRPTPAASTPAASPTPTPSPASTPPPATGTVPPPLSVTFVGSYTGWVLGQTRPAGQCDLAAAAPCLALERTDSSGTSWRPAGAPPAHGPDGATGASQVRFLNRSDGWAFGPQLWATHDSGRTWSQIATGGLRVTALETRGTQVFAVWAHCTGAGPRFAAHCTGFAVYSSPAGSNNWAPVPGASAGPAAGQAGGSATLMLTGSTAYLLLPDGSLLAGPPTGAAWPAAGRAATPCRPGPPQAGGQPSGALLSVNGTASLVLLCTGPSGGGQQARTLYTSGDGGRSWQRTGTAPAAGTATSLSGSLSGTLVLATSLGIQISANGGGSWTAAGGALPAGGFGYVGMTTASQGFAIPADPGQHAIWFTYDGGQTWAPSPVSG